MYPVWKIKAQDLAKKLSLVVIIGYRQVCKVFKRNTLNLYIEIFRDVIVFQKFAEETVENWERVKENK